MERWKGMKQNGRQWDGREKCGGREREREGEMANGKEEESGFETKGRQFKLAEC